MLRSRADLASAAGMVAGAALDRWIADPRRAHPVAAFGSASAWLEGKLYADARSRGVAYAAMAVGVPVACASAAQRLTRGRPATRFVLTAAATWAVLGGTTLRREAGLMATALEGGDLGAARARLPHLAGRDPSGLDGDGLARATVESVAENTSDAVVAPLVWGAIAGLPGLIGYRAVNTLDAMVGYRSPRYRRFGWASARLDDLANLIPARFTGALTVIAARPGRRRETYRVWRRDHANHPSPNAGHCEAAVAGALGLSLGGANVYSGQTEHRPVMGDGPPPSILDIRKAIALSATVSAAALVLTAGHVAARPLRRALYARVCRR